MKKNVSVLACLLFLTCTASAQIFVGSIKGIAKIDLKSEFHHYKKTSTITETDSSYNYALRGDVKPEDVYLFFDRRGVCTFEKWKSDCDECYQQVLKRIFDKKRFQWKSIGNNEYLSKTSHQLKLTEYPSQHMFTITQMFMRDEDYNVLYQKRTN